MPAKKLDVDLAGIEAGLVVEDNRNGERRGLLRECRSGSAGEQQKRGNQAKIWIFIHEDKKVEMRSEDY